MIEPSVLVDELNKAFENHPDRAKLIGITTGTFVKQCQTYLAKETKELKEALVECAIPYEAILMDAESKKWIAPEVWNAIENAVLAARTTLKIG